MRKISLLLCLVTIALSSLPGQTVTVYPGDANDSRLCNHVDLLHIGLNFGQTGPSRNFFPNITWTAQPGQSWSGPVGIDRAYSDCDGDGIVERNDAQAIEANFGQTVPGLVPLPDTTSIGSVNGPHLSVNIIQDSVSVPVNGQVVVTLAIDLGSPNSPVDSIYGYAYTLDFDPVIVDQLNFSFTPGNFAVDSSGLTFFRVDTILGKLYVAATNVDHQNRSGSGTISTIGIVMDDDIRIAAIGHLFMQPSYFLAYTASKALVPVYPEGDSLKVITGIADQALESIRIYPNPSNGRVWVEGGGSSIQRISLHDIQGRQVAAPCHLESNNAIIDTDQLTPGCYFLEVHANEGTLHRRLVIH